MNDPGSPFLAPSAVIDHDHPSVRRLAAELFAGTADPVAFARRCFVWVRDQVQHSIDHNVAVVTCSASETLQHRAGLCYAKSHLLVALLRAGGLPAALSYQRLALDGAGESFGLHGLVSVFLPRHGWYRVDPRGDKPGMATDFCPPRERLAFTPQLPGEMDVPGHFPEPLPDVVSALRRYATMDDLVRNLPDY